MPKYPIYLDLNGKRTVVIGAGPVAARKVQNLADAGARVIVIAEHTDTTFQETCSAKNIELIISTYSKNYLSKALLAIAATNDTKLNRQIYKDCQELEVLCNVVDNPELCDFFVPAIVQKGPLHIAIGTDGSCPAYAGHIRKKLDTLFTDNQGRFCAELEKIRPVLKEQIKNSSMRKAIIGKLAGDESFDFFTKNGPEQWRVRANDILEKDL